MARTPTGIILKIKQDKIVIFFQKNYMKINMVTKKRLMKIPNKY